MSDRIWDMLLSELGVDASESESKKIGEIAFQVLFRHCIERLCVYG